MGNEGERLASSPRERKAAAQDGTRFHTAQQAAVARLGGLALESDDVDVLLDEATNLVERVLGTSHGGLCEYDESTESFVIQHVWGWPPDEVRGLRLPGGTSHAGYTVAQGEPVVSDDLALESRFDIHPLWHREGIRSVLAVPIRGSDAPFGVICAQSRTPNSFTRNDVLFCQAIAHVIGGAVVRRRSADMIAKSEKLESLGRLSGAIAHDFKNLLAVVNGFVRLAARMSTDDQVLDFLNEARVACERATALTQQLLTFARNSEPELELVDLGQIVTAMHSVVQQAVGDAIDVTIRRDDGLPQVMADATHLEQVVMNLAVNARDAMPEGGRLSIDVTVIGLDDASLLKDPSAKLDPGGYLRLLVEDTGVGMSEEVRARALEPFFSTKTKDEGTGLGLATVYGVVAQLGGHIQIDSEEGKGTRFEILLPPAERVVVSVRAPAVSTGNVLVVEDNEQLRALICRILEASGYRTIPVGTA
ncbi:MAG: ATP-binding protein, partial [Actinomycetota bacterium]